MPASTTTITVRGDINLSYIMQYVAPTLSMKATISEDNVGIVTNDHCKRPSSISVLDWGRVPEDVLIKASKLNGSPSSGPITVTYRNTTCGMPLREIIKFVTKTYLGSCSINGSSVTITSDLGSTKSAVDILIMAFKLDRRSWDHPDCKNSKVFMAGFVDGIKKSRQMLNSGNGQIATRMNEYNRGKELGVKSRSRI